MKERAFRFDMRLTADGRGMVDALAARWGVDRTTAIMVAVTDSWGRQNRKYGHLDQGEMAAVTDSRGRQNVSKRGRKGGAR